MLDDPGYPGRTGGGDVDRRPPKALNKTAEPQPASGPVQLIYGTRWTPGSIIWSAKGIARATGYVAERDSLGITSYTSKGVWANAGLALAFCEGGSEIAIRGFLWRDFDLTTFANAEAPVGIQRLCASSWTYGVRQPGVNFCPNGNEGGWFASGPIVWPRMAVLETLGLIVGRDDGATPGGIIPPVLFEIQGLARDGGDYANPADVMSDLWARCGQDPNALDVEDYGAWCAENGFEVARIVDGGEDAFSLMAQLAEETCAAFVWSDGVMRVVPLPAVGTPSSVSLESQDFILSGGSPVSIDRVPLQDTVTLCPVEYLRADGIQADTPDSALSDELARTTGVVRRAGSFSAQWLCTPAGAHRLSAMLAHRSFEIRNRARLTVSARHIRLEPGDVINLTLPAMGLEGVDYRITAIEDSADGQTIAIEAEEYLGATFQTAPVYLSEGGSGSPIPDPSQAAPGWDPDLTAIEARLNELGSDARLSLSDKRQLVAAFVDLFGEHNAIMQRAGQFTSSRVDSTNYEASISRLWAYATAPIPTGGAEAGDETATESGFINGLGLGTTWTGKGNWPHGSHSLTTDLAPPRSVYDTWVASGDGNGTIRIHGDTFRDIFADAFQDRNLLLGEMTGSLLNSVDALTALNAIAEDGKLAYGEKRATLNYYLALVDEYPGLDARAGSQGFSAGTGTRKTYADAIDALKAYFTAAIPTDNDPNNASPSTGLGLPAASPSEAQIHTWQTTPPDIAIHPATFRARFASAYSSRNALVVALQADVDSKANSALYRLDLIANDGTITQGEKRGAWQEYAAIMGGVAALNSKADASAAMGTATNTEHEAYKTAITALQSYMSGLRCPATGALVAGAWSGFTQPRLTVTGDLTSWLNSRLSPCDSATGDCTIVRDTFLARFGDCYTTAATLEAKIAATLAGWSYDTGSGMSASARANQAAVDAAAAVADAQAAQAEAAQARADAQAAQAAAWGKSRSFYQTSAPNNPTPAGYALQVDDTWFDTDDSYRPYRWNGTAWVDVTNPAINTISARNRTFYQATAPANPTNGITLAVGDLWFDTSANYAIKRWDGATWASARDTSNDSKNRVYTGTRTQRTAATGLVAGDLWVETDNEKATWRYASGAWGRITPVTFTGSRASRTNGSGYVENDTWAETDYNNQLWTYKAGVWVDLRFTAIDAKNQTRSGTASQMALATGMVAGDLWICTDQSNAVYRYSGTAWVNLRDTTNDSKNRTWVGTSTDMAAVTGAVAGDLFIRTDDSNCVYRYSGAAWARVTLRSSIGTRAQRTALTGMIKGDTFIESDQGNLLWTYDGAVWVSTVGGIKSTVGTIASRPTTGNATGDLYFATDQGYAIYRWNGTGWDSVRDIGNIDASRILGTLPAGSLADGSVDAAKLAAATLTGTQVARVIAAEAIGANQIAANAIVAGKIAADAITAREIAAEAITASEIAASAITAGKIAANAVVATNLAANSVIAGKIDVGAVRAGNIAAGAINAQDIIANDMITGPKIVSGSVTANKLTLVPGGGAALNADPGCSDLTAWDTSQANFSNLSVVQVDGPTGSKATAIRGWSVWLVDGKHRSVRPSTMYRVTAKVRRNSTAGGMYIRASQVNSTGSVVQNLVWKSQEEARAYSGSTWENFSPLASTTDWQIVTGYVLTTPAAQAVRLYAILADGNGSASNYHEIADFKIEDMIDASVVVDGSITAKSLTLVNFDNLIPNPNSEAPAPDGGWPSNAIEAAGLTTETPYAGSQCRKASTGAVILTNYIPCAPGDKFYYEAMCRVANVAGCAIGLTYYDAARAKITDHAVAVTATTYTKTTGTSTAPANAYFVRAFISDLGWGGQAIWGDNFYMRRMADSSLIVDGAITGVKISGESLETSDYAYWGSKGTANEYATRGARLRTSATDNGGNELPAILASPAGIKIGTKTINQTWLSQAKIIGFNVSYTQAGGLLVNARAGQPAGVSISINSATSTLDISTGVANAGIFVAGNATYGSGWAVPAQWSNTTDGSGVAKVAIYPITGMSVAPIGGTTPWAATFLLCVTATTF